MSAVRNLGAVAVLSVAGFLAAFAASFAITGVASALAQPGQAAEAVEPAEPVAPGQTEPRPDHGFAPPSDEDPPAADAVAPVGAHGDAKPTHGAAGHGDHDPTKGFNFFDLGYGGKDEFGGKFGDGVMVDPHTGQAIAGEEQPMSAPFVLLVFNFLILVVLLVWKGRPAVRQLAKDRHDLIKNALDDAAKLRNQAAAKLAEYETRLKDADLEIRNLVEGMQKDAEADRARILANAANQAAQLQREAEQRIAAEIALARASLTREVAAAATAAAEKLLRGNVMSGDQQSLVSTFVAELHAQQVAQPKERA